MMRPHINEKAFAIPLRINQPSQNHILALLPKTFPEGWICFFYRGSE